MKQLNDKKEDKQKVLKKLQFDPSKYDPFELIKFAEQGKYLDQLVDYDCWPVRKAVAQQGYGLDKLINDEEWAVRQVVAEQGYGLDILSKDPEVCVRWAVVQQGYSIDILDDNESNRVGKIIALLDKFLLLVIKVIALPANVTELLIKAILR